MLSDHAKNTAYKFSSKFVHYSFLLLPVLYILGPAIPDIIITITAVLFVINKIFFKNEKNNLILYFIIIIFWLYLISSSFWSINFSKSIISSLAYLRFLLLPFALNYFIKDKEFFFLSLSRILFFIIVLLGFDIIIQNFTGRDVFGFPSVMSGARNSGFFGYELIAGSFISKFFLIGIIFFSSKYNLVKKNLYFVFIFFIVFLSGERMAFLNTVLIIFVYLFFSKDYKQNLVILMSIFVLLSISFVSLEKNKNRMYNDVINIIKFGTYNDKGEYTEHIYDRDGNIVRGKLTILDSGWGAHWLTAYNIFKLNPIFGTGIRSFRFVCSDPKYKTISASDDNRCSTHPHNYYMEILSELGLVGFIFIFIIYLKFIILNFKSMKNNKNHIIIFSCFISCMWPLATTGSFFSNSFAILIWFIIGLSLLERKKIN